MARKKPNPRLADLERQADKLQEDCEKHYRRLRTAFHRLEKARRTLARVNKRIDAAVDATLND